jgi:hypothetical protein
MFDGVGEWPHERTSEWIAMAMVTEVRGQMLDRATRSVDNLSEARVQSVHHGDEILQGWKIGQV